MLSSLYLRRSIGALALVLATLPAAARVAGGKPVSLVVS
jgi:hypothetical protein